MKGQMVRCVQESMDGYKQNVESQKLTDLDRVSMQGVTLLGPAA